MEHETGAYMPEPRYEPFGLEPTCARVAFKRRCLLNAENLHPVHDEASIALHCLQFGSYFFYITISGFGLVFFSFEVQSGEIYTLSVHALLLSRLCLWRAAFNGVRKEITRCTKSKSMNSHVFRTDSRFSSILSVAPPCEKGVLSKVVRVVLLRSTVTCLRWSSVMR
jgi:hypothetical protein